MCYRFYQGYHMLHRKTYLHFCLLFMTVNNYYHPLNALDPLAWLPTSWVAHQREQTSLTYPLAQQQCINVTIDHGLVSLDTWNQPNAAFHITKKGRTSESIKNIHVRITETIDSIDITIEQPEDQTSVELILIVPAHLKVTIACQQVGDITVTNAPLHSKLSTQEGSITVENNQGETIDCYTEHGDISIVCSLFSEKSLILARAPHGSITLHTPQTLNAELDAKTVKGSITVMHPLALEKITFPHFDKHQVAKLNKKIQGIIGSGGPLISLTARNDIIIASDA